MGLLKNIQNYLFEVKFKKDNVRDNSVKNLQNYIARVQFARLKTDIAAWREGIKEAEQAFYPHRVKMQRVFIDTVLNGHVDACMNKRKDQVLLKKFYIKEGDKINETATDVINKTWFNTMLNYIFDAKFYGYSLIALNDLVNNEFPDMTIIKRQNVSPDRHQVVSYVYSLSGLDFLDESIKDPDGNSYFDWTIYIDTPTDTGLSNCGYGLLYKVAYYEIFIRNNMGYNATALELFGQPVRVGRTAKTDEYERQAYFDSLVNMGSNAAILLDAVDELELQYAPTGSGKNQGFANLEERCTDMISKILLGHNKALDATAGKLGAEDNSLDALEMIEKADTKWLEDTINTKVLPKLIKLGLPIPAGAVFCFSNDKEELEIKMRNDDEAIKLATMAQTLKNAGMTVDPAWFQERTGVPVTKEEQPEVIPGLDPKKKDALNKLYGNIK